MWNNDLVLAVRDLMQFRAYTEQLGLDLRRVFSLKVFSLKVTPWEDMVTVWCLMCIEGVSFVKGEFSITSASNARSYIPLSHICFYCVSQDPDNGSCGSYPADRGPLNVILKLNISKRPCQFVKKHEFSESFCISKTLRKHAISQTCPSGWPVLTCVSCLLLVTH